MSESSVRTFADALREARDAPRMMAMAAPSGYVSPEQETGESGAADTLESRIVQPRGPHDPANLIARCDYCARTTLADALAEVEPDGYACDGCVTAWAR